MLRPATPLPDRLLQLGVFTLAEAVAAGAEPNRLRRSDVERLGKCLYAVAGVDHSSVGIASAVCRMFPGAAWISHATGAQARGLELPHSIDLLPVHVTRLRPGSVPRVGPITGQHATVRLGEVTRLGDIPVATPARIWLELAASLTEMELVEFGDHLVRIPRPQFEGRSEPHAPLAELARFLGWHPRIAGAAKAAAALSRIRVGSDSVMETRLRLAFIDAGLPEPELQVALDPLDPFSPVSDLGYRGPRIAIDYDGGTHLTAEQQARDIRRDRQFALAGWRHLTANKHDAAESFRTLIEQVRVMVTWAA